MRDDHPVYAPPQLTLTGQRHRNLYVVRLNGHDVALSHSCLFVLVELLRASGDAGEAVTYSGSFMPTPGMPQGERTSF